MDPNSNVELYYDQVSLKLIPFNLYSTHKQVLIDMHI